jgi:hypothetical protein
LPTQWSTSLAWVVLRICVSWIDPSAVPFPFGPRTERFGPSHIVRVYFGPSDLVRGPKG